jgi:hypothetical protein
MIATSLREGARRTLRHGRLIVLLYLCNLAAALVLALPVGAAISKQLANSLESDRLFTNLDPGWISEMVLQHGTAPFTAFGIVVAAVSVLFLVLNTFLSGGAIAVFHNERDTFFGACARFFPRLLRLLLVALVCYGLVLAVNAILASSIARFRENSMEARPWILLGWARTLLTLFLLGTVNLIFDYSKIICVVENKRSALKSAIRGYLFVFSRLGKTFSIYWICSLIGLLFLLAYHGFSELIGQNTAAAIILLFFIRQAYMAMRMWVRLWTWASEVAYYEASRQTLSSTIVAPEPPSLAVAG